MKPGGGGEAAAGEEENGERRKRRRERERSSERKEEGRSKRSRSPDSSLEPAVAAQPTAIDHEFEEMK